jgi:tRNA modification GTPase
MSDAPTYDTIAAIITPPGEGGIAAVRVAGPRATELLQRHFRPLRAHENARVAPFVMRLGHIVDHQDAVIDEAMAVFMPHGQSYTGLDQAELFTHGGRLVVRQVLATLIHSGARAASPGEFTRLAFLHGRIDLARAEAVADIIAANTDRSLTNARSQLLGAYSQHIEQLRFLLIDTLAEIEASVDFPEEHIETADTGRISADLLRTEQQVDNLLQTYRGGRILREGFRVVIGGRPNAGKSSLFNLLLGQTRALVTPTPGTTRDYLSEWVDLDGFAVNLLDTAGLRTTRSKLEQAGQAITEDVMAGADLVLWMFDLSRRAVWSEFTTDLKRLGQTPRLLVGNKLDLAPSPDPTMLDTIAADAVLVSCKTNEGIAALRDTLQQRIESMMPDMTEGLIVTSERHAASLRQALDHLQAARELIQHGASPELPALELRSALSSLEEITGRVYTEDVLDRIFSRFCVGK